MAEVLMVRIEPTADASLAAMRARSKFGIAMAAMINIIATTISSSISENPLLVFLLITTFLVLAILAWSARADLAQRFPLDSLHPWDFVPSF
jgi:hypothetical protein